MHAPYSHALYPSVPVLEIHLINPLSGQKSALHHAILGPEADATAIPSRLCSRYDVVQVFVVDFEIDGVVFNGPAQTVELMD